ncbi:hypothetical protein C8R44DRAFT_871753 [Mycena epipterygia]|nr:hypothetical protein C8R44DRAFT_871753 [Mycena epipterygia]
MQFNVVATLVLTFAAIFVAAAPMPFSSPVDAEAREATDVDGRACRLYSCI